MMFGNYTISDSCSAQNHVCEVDYNLEPADNFLEDERSYAGDSFLYAISCASLICFAGTLFHFTNKTIVFYKDLSIISIIFLTLIFAFDVYTMGKETCLFAKWCHEGIDDQIIPAFYFYQMNECPRYGSWLAGDYSEYDMNHNDKCDSTEYGCCEIWDIECDTSYREGDTYSFYQFIRNRNISHWTLGINKLDEEGSNCPTIEELIYQVSKNDLASQIVNAIISYTITTIVIMFLCMICRMCTKKDDYEKTDSEEVAMKESV